LNLGCRSSSLFVEAKPALPPSVAVETEEELPSVDEDSVDSLSDEVGKC